LRLYVCAVIRQSGSGFQQTKGAFKGHHNKLILHKPTMDINIDLQGAVPLSVCWIPSPHDALNSGGGGGGGGGGV
jgi:hypothetical protein